MSRIIYVDMDEVLADCVGNLLFAYNRIYDADIKLEDITEWKLPKDMSRLFKFPGFFENLPPVPGAIEGIRRLDAAYTPVIATDCMDDAYIRMEKVKWIQRYLPEFIPSKRVVFSSYKHKLKGYAIIDDAPHHLELFKGFRVCVDRPWNQDAEADYRVFDQDWGEIIKLFKDVI